MVSGWYYINEEQGERGEDVFVNQASIDFVATRHRKISKVVSD